MNNISKSKIKFQTFEAFNAAGVTADLLARGVGADVIAEISAGGAKNANASVKFPNRLATLCAKKAISGKTDELTFFQESNYPNCDFELLVGFGRINPNIAEYDKPAFNALLARVRAAAANAARRAVALNLNSVVFYDFPRLTVDADENGGGAPPQVYEAIAEGALLGQYRFGKNKRADARENATGAIEQIYILADEAAVGDVKFDDFRNAVELNARVMAEATIRTRDMVNEPSNIMTPIKMAECAQAIAADSQGKIKCEIFADRQAAPLNEMRAYLGVAQGSANPPRMIQLTYKNDDDKSAPSLFLIGKSITFDTGGLSLKPPRAMLGMKADMSGGAAVIAAIEGVAKLNLKANVTALCLAAENMPGGKAQRPNDIVRSMDGSYIEIDNTDAEGRLTIADAVAYAKRAGATHIVDVATLTGAMRIALGYTYAGGYSNDENLMQLLVDASHECGEPIWPLPIDDTIRGHNKSDFADIRNVGDKQGYAGSATAAAFIEHFVGDAPWAHLDIAGTSMSPKTHGVFSVGATGAAARTLIKATANIKRLSAPKAYNIEVAYWPASKNDG